MGDFARNEKKTKENGKKSSSTCGPTFDSFQQICDSRSNPHSKFGAQHFCDAADIFKCKKFGANLLASLDTRSIYNFGHLSF